MEFDRTRKSIGANDLDQDARKSMLNKFTGAGGKVLSEKALRQQEEQRRRAAAGGAGQGAGKGGGGAAGTDIKLPSELAREKNRADADRQAQLRRIREAEERDAMGFMARLSIKFRCALSGLTPFGTSMVRPNFLSRLNLEGKRALMECSIMSNDIFMSNPQTARVIIKELDEKNPLLVELIERAGALYDRNELSELTSAYQAAPTLSVPLDAIRIPLFSLLRKLYYLKAYGETYINAVDQAIAIQQRIEKKQSALYATKRKKIAQEWKILMNDIYYNLVLLAQRAEMKKAEPGSRLFEEMIGVIQEDKIGSRKLGESIGSVKLEKKDKPADAATEEKAEEDSEEETESEPVEDQDSLELEHGMKLMQMHSVAALRQKHAMPEAKELNDRDKVLLSMLFFKEFDAEYSFILTTPKIELNVIYNEGRKIDYRQILADVFETSRTSYEIFRKYAQETAEYMKGSQEGGVNPANYVNHAKKMQLLESKRGASGREARNEIKNYMRRVEKELRILKEDMAGGEKIVKNKDGILKFDLAADQKKRLNGKQVKEAVMETYCFARALAQRIENGDLFGGVIEMSEEEYARSFGTGA